VFVDSLAFSALAVSVEGSSDMYDSFPLRDYRPPCHLDKGVAVAECGMSIGVIRTARNDFAMNSDEFGRLAALR